MVEGQQARPRLAQLLYRSVAKAPFTDADLRRLADQARRRNGRESLTGLLVFDRGRFLQYLEGPEDGLQRVWASICRDARHQAIERLPLPTVHERLFPDWRLQVATPDAAVAQAKHALRLPIEALLELREHGSELREILQGIAFQCRLPEAAALALLLAQGDEAVIAELGERIATLAPSWTVLGMHFVGPVERALGDAWCDDRLGAADVVIAQARLQVLLRQAAARRLACTTTPPRGVQVLVAPVPGETDFVGLTFASTAFDAAGWQVQCAFPKTPADLEHGVASQSIDVLHLALSDAFTREHCLGDLAKTIRKARGASANPNLLVLVSGRAFVQQPGLSTVLGADGLGLAQGSRVRDVEAMLTWARIRAGSAGRVVAQAALNDVCRQVQQRHFGAAEERTQ